MFDDFLDTPISTDLEQRIKERETIIIKEKEKFLVVYDTGQCVYLRVHNETKTDRIFRCNEQQNTYLNFHLRTGTWTGDWAAPPGSNYVTTGMHASGNLFSFIPVKGGRDLFREYEEELTNIMSLLQKHSTHMPEKPFAYPEATPLVKEVQSYGKKKSPLFSLFSLDEYEINYRPDLLKKGVKRITDVDENYMGHVALVENDVQSYVERISIFSPASYFQFLKQCEVKQSQEVLQKAESGFLRENDKIYEFYICDGREYKVQKNHDSFRCSAVHLVDPDTHVLSIFNRNVDYMEFGALFRVHFNLKKYGDGVGFLQRNDPRLILPVDRTLVDKLANTADIPHSKRNYLTLYKQTPEGVQKKGELFRGIK